MSSAFRTLIGFMLAAVVASGGGAALANSGSSGALPDQSNGKGHAVVTEESDLDTENLEAGDTDGPRVWDTVSDPTNHGEAVSAAAHCQDVGTMNAPEGCMDDPKIRAEYVQSVAHSDLGKPTHDEGTLTGTDTDDDETTEGETTDGSDSNGKGPKDPNPGRGHASGGDAGE